MCFQYALVALFCELWPTWVPRHSSPSPQPRESPGIILLLRLSTQWTGACLRFTLFVSCLFGITAFIFWCPLSCSVFSSILSFLWLFQGNGNLNNNPLCFDTCSLFAWSFDFLLFWWWWQGQGTEGEWNSRNRVCGGDCLSLKLKSCRLDVETGKAILSGLVDPNVKVKAKLQ